MNFSSLPPLTFSWRLALLAFVFVLGGCASFRDGVTASPDYRAKFAAPPDKVWEALVDVLKDLPIKEADASRQRVETEWMEGWSERTLGAFGGGFMGNQWKKRVGFVARLLPAPGGGTELRLVSRVQEKTPGGTRAFRWQPVPSDGKMEKEIIQRIHLRLET